MNHRTRKTLNPKRVIFVNLEDTFTDVALLISWSYAVKVSEKCGVQSLI